jgi:hypothetical protein
LNGLAGTTSRRPARWAFVLLCATLAAGCASLGGKSGQPAPGPKAQAERQKAPGLSRQRLMLSEGYSLLYKDASNLDLAGLIVYVKTESDEVDDLVTAVAKFGGDLKRDLERVARDYPGVRIDLDPLPEMETRKRQALAKARARYFAPVIGKGGREYELSLLIAYSNGLNHERFMCQVMAEEEPDPGLKKLLLNTEKGYSGLYDRTMALLENEYFRDPKGPSR